MAKRWARWVLALGLFACHRPAAPGAQHAPSIATQTADALASLRDDLIVTIERDAPAAQNACGSASALLSAARGARDDVARRIRGRLRAAVTPALASGKPDCLVDVAARLVPLSPDRERRALISDLARLYEKGLEGWGLYRAVMPAIAPHLTVQEADRFAAAVSNTKGPSCFRTIVFAHLADVGRLPPRKAFTAMQETRDLHCLELDELDVLRFADPTILRALYPGEMSLLDDPPAAFGLQHVRTLSLLAPYLEPGRRRALIAAAFRVMPKVYVSEPGGHNDWGELPPEFHFYMAMLRMAPLIDAGLVDAALAAIPPAWPAESRAYAAAGIATALPPALRRARLGDFLAAIPGPRDGAAASAARLALAADLAPQDAREALDVVVKTQTDPWVRAPTVAGALPALPPSSRPAFARLVREDVATTKYADSRISTAAAALDALDGIRH